MKPAVIDNVAVLEAHDNREQIFPFAAALAALENHDGENAVRGKKPHQGIFFEKRALHRGIEWCNSTTALGLRGVGLETRVRSRCQGKERDAETLNDDFGARYYSWRFGRWLSSDWSAVPVAVPYANLTNPQTLNLYSMVADDPESFADLDGHYWGNCSELTGNPECAPEQVATNTTSEANLAAQVPPEAKAQKKTHHPKPKPKPKPVPLPSKGQASIYAQMFEGRSTASGKKFHQNGYTAALLPRSRWDRKMLGTHVKLTHGNKTVVVEINDFGKGKPGQEDRALDLSRAAASTLTGAEINDDEDANKVGLIQLDAIVPVPSDTPVGPQPAPQPSQ